MRTRPWTTRGGWQPPPPNSTRSGYAFEGYFNGDDKFSSTTIISSETTFTARWTYIDSSNTGGSNDNDDDNGTTTPPQVKDPVTNDGETNVDIDVDPTTSGGNSSADIPNDTLEEAVKDALDEVKDTDNAPKVTINVNTPSSADGVEVKFDSSALEDLVDRENAVFEIKSDVGTVSFDKTALESIISQVNGEDVTIIIKEATDLTNEQKAAVGNRPTYELLVKVGSSYITDFDGGIATVTVPYTLTGDEESEEVAVYHVDANGDLNYKSTTYNATTRKATFTTTHFSAFTVRIISKDNPSTGGLPFTDIPTDAWCYDDVVFVYINDFMQGISATTFEPNGTVTRAMMAQVIWNMESNPAALGSNPFSDIVIGDWYYDAVVWTAENGIYKGMTDTTFASNAPITREQLAAIFYRYAEYKGYDLTPRGDLSQFTDADQVSDWATEDMMWAIGSELMFGKGDGILDPGGTATRAEIAAMIHRFVRSTNL